MINDALVFLKSQLNAHLKAKSGWAPGDSAEDKVVFLDSDKMDPLTFKMGAVSVLLINIEEENTLREADRYARIGGDGSRLHVQPDVRLN